MKRILVLLAMIGLLAACTSEEPVEKSPVVEDETEQNNETPNETETPDTNEEEPEEPTKEEPTPEVNEDEPSDVPEEETPPVGDVEEEEEDTPVVTDDPEQLVDLTFAVFEAMEKEDYDFLQSILSKGSSLSVEEKLFTFENVGYPHEQEFITNESAAEIEHRYTNDEDPEKVIVGFAAIDYVNEYSYVIDMEYIIEDNVWKMNDMDVNK